MKSHLLTAIEAYQKSGENLRNAADVALAAGKNDLTFDQATELLERIYEGGLNGARAEGRIMEIRATTIAKERRIELGKIVNK